MKDKQLARPIIVAITSGNTMKLLKWNISIVCCGVEFGRLYYPRTTGWPMTSNVWQSLRQFKHCHTILSTFRLLGFGQYVRQPRSGHMQRNYAWNQLTGLSGRGSGSYERKLDWAKAGVLFSNFICSWSINLAKIPRCVCMNTYNSEIIVVRSIKFADNMSKYFAQLEFVSEFGHASLRCCKLEVLLLKAIFFDH